jgi:hypothetical protein
MATMKASDRGNYKTEVGYNYVPNRQQIIIIIIISITDFNYHFTMSFRTTRYIYKR